MSDDQFTKLAKTIETGFGQVNTRFTGVETTLEGVDVRLTSHDRSFEKYFAYIEDFRQEFRQHVGESRREHADIRAGTGELAAQIRSYHEEVLAMSHQLDRMKEAIKQIAAETGVKLKFEL